MSSLSITAIIIIAATCGGVAVLGVLGLVFMLLRRRGQRRYLDESIRAQLSRRNGDLDPREIETYTPSASHGKMPHWRRLRTRVYGQDSPSILRKSSVAIGEDGSKETSVRETSQGYRIVPNGGDGDQIDLEPVEKDELVDIYLPAGRPERAPLTPISERDTPDSSRRALPRPEHHLPENSRKWRHFGQQGRNPSPGWFSDSSSASSSKLSKQRRLRAKGKSKSTTDLAQPGVLRSLSFRSARNEPKTNGDLMPTPDAIYDACSRLSPSSSRRIGRFQDRRGSDSDAAQTPSARSSIFDGHGSHTTAGSTFPSIRTASKRSSKKDLHSDIQNAEPLKNRETERVSRPSALLGSSPIANALRSSISKDAIPSLDQRLDQNRKGSPLSAYINKDTVKSSVPTKLRLADESLSTHNARHMAKQKSSQPFKFWHERVPKSKRAPLSKRAKARILQESAGNSKRRSLSISPTSSFRASKFKSKRSHDSESPSRLPPSAPPWQRKHDSVRRMLFDETGSENVALQAIVMSEDKPPDESNPRRSVLLPEIELKALSLSPKREMAAKFDAIKTHSEDLVGPSALWSIIGDQSDASESHKPEIHQSRSGYSFEDSEDVLQLPSHDETRLDPDDAHASRHSNEFDDIKPPLPLRPRSGMLKIEPLPAPTESRHLSSEILSDSSLAASELPQSLRIGNSSRTERTALRQISQRNIEKRRSGGSPPFRRSEDQIDQSQGQLTATSRNPHKVSRFSNSIAPPNHPPPPPPPPPPFTSPRSQVRMTSMMMELRRQNSDSSRYDSSYFRLPQSQRGSQSSQRTSHNDLGVRHSSSRSSRSYVGNSEAAETNQAAQPLPGIIQGVNIQSGSSLWDRRARRERDPFTEHNSKKHHQNFSRPQLFVITSPNYLPGYENENLSAEKNALDQFEHFDRQELIGQAIELGMSSEPILLLNHSREGSNVDPHRTPSDDSEQDLSPMGRTIMAKTRREQYDRQQRNGSLTSTRTSTEWQRSLHSPPSLSPPQSQYFQRPLPRPGTSQSTVRLHQARPSLDHRRNKSSLSSVGRNHSGGLDELSQTEYNTVRTSSLADGRKSRRESQRQRVETLKERVASMEFAMKGKSRPEPIITYN